MQTGENRIRSFAPIVGDDPKVLILGSMPGLQSLAQEQYYGNPRNHFWRLMAAVLREETVQDYQTRLNMLLRNRIALWDSIASCCREGSLDSAIQKVVPNEIGALIKDNPTIVAIFFNGQKAQKEFFRYHDVPQGVEAILLPSSSPVPRKGFINMEGKLPFWLKIREFL